MLKNKFNVFEMLEMAKEIENRGYRLYSTHAKLAKDQKLKDLFNKLANDEQDHYNTFDELEKKYKEKEEKDYSYLEDVKVNDYLKNLVEYEVFPKGEREELKEMETEEVLDKAIKSEKDSILLYQELVPYNNEETKEILYRLIKEEKEHYVSLVNYKREM
ncbi:MAG: ferritin family protein [Halanaerobiales bacterium]|nr:ferritin family protein [Halanaerobiales bacterium]